MPPYGVDPELAKRFEDSLHRHVNYVIEAGKQIGVPDHLLEKHDLSKLDAEEFSSYAHWFGGDKSDPAGFAQAWLHHIHNNPHHGQYWIFSDGYTLPGANLENGIMEMPEEYALEMIADWMGASMAYTGSWDMTDWLMKNASHIKVHSKTNHFLVQKLFELGYSDLVCIYQIGFGVKNIWEQEG